MALLTILDSFSEESGQEVEVSIRAMDKCGRMSPGRMASLRVRTPEVADEVGGM